MDKWAIARLPNGRQVSYCYPDSNMMAAVCAGILAWAGSSLCALLILLSGIVAYSYTAPPLAIAYRGHGLAEIAALLGYGMLPALVASTAQQNQLTWPPILLAAPFGLLAASLLLMHDYFHPDADQGAGKWTPVVAFGAQGAWTLLGMLIVSVVASLLLTILLMPLPLWTLFLLLTALPMGWAWTPIMSTALSVRPPYMTSARLASRIVS